MATSIKRIADSTISAYSGTVSCQYMENHRPVRPLGPQSVVGAAMSSQGEPLLFSIDSAGNIGLAVCATNAPAPGWQATQIATEIVAQYTQNSQTALATNLVVSQDDATANISVMMVMEVTDSQQNQWDEVWLLSGMPNVPSSEWMSDAAARNWTKIAFDAQDVQNVSAKNLSINDLRILKFTDSAPPQTIVHVMGSNGVLQAFYVAADGSTPAWTPLASETDYSVLKDAAVGLPDWAFAAGLFKIYVAGGVTSLTYISSDDDVTYYPVTAPSALATLAYSDPDGYLVTELYVCDGNQIKYFPDTVQPGAAPSGDQLADVVPIYTLAAPTWLPAGGCTQLLAGCDGQVVSLWGLTADGRIFHMQAPFADRAEPSAWSTPVPLMANVSAADMHISDTRGLTSVFAVQNNPPAPLPAVPLVKPGAAGNPANLAAANPYTTGGPQLIELHKDHLTAGGKNHWRKRFVHLPDENAYQTLQTYTHRVQFTNQYSQPAGEMQVLVTASSSVVLEVNNQNITVPCGTGATVTTDAAGMLEVVLIANSPAAPTLTFSLLDNGVVNADWQVTIDPTGPVRAAAQAGVAVPGAPVANSNGALSQQSWYNSSSLGNAQTAMGKLPSNAAGAIRLSREETERSLGDGLLDDIGDILNALYEGVSDFVSAFVNATDDGLTLIVNFVDFTFTALIATAEDVAGAIVAVLTWVGAAIEDVFQWLAFLFNWGNIKAICDNLTTLYSALLQNADAVAAALFAEVGTQLQGYASQVAGYDTSNIPSQNTGQISQSSAATQSANTPSGAPSSNDPRLSWGQSQVPTPNGSSAASAYWRMNVAAFHRAEKAPAASSADPMSQFLSDLGTFVSNIGDALLNFAEGNLDLQSFAAQAQRDGAQALSACLNDMAAELSAQQSAISSTLAPVISGLTAQQDIPLFSSLYQDATGEPLTFLSLFALLQAVPATLLYGIATNGNGQASDFLSPAQTASVLAQYNALANPSAGTPLPASQAPRDGAPLDPQLAANLRLVLGVAHVIRAASSYWLYKSEETPYSLAPATVDSLLWLAEAGLDIALNYAEEGTKGITPTANAVFAVIAIMICAGNKLEYNQKKLLLGVGGWSWFASFFEIARGIDQLATDSGELNTLDSAVWISYGVNEFLEYPQWYYLQSETTNSSLASGLFCARVALMIVAGGLQFWAGLVEEPSS